MVKLSYNNRGNVSGIDILCGGNYCPVPWNLELKLIEWDLLEYPPTRMALQAAWEEWSVDKNLQFELRDIQPNASQLKMENWEGWNEFMFEDSGYNKAVRAAIDQISRGRLETLFLRRFFQPGMIVLWNRFIESPPEECKPTLAEIEIWRNAVVLYSMPFNFTDAGLMEISQ